MSEAGKEENDKSILPGVAGAVVNTVNSKPVTALLGPLSKAYGDYWGELATERLEKRREKRRENIRKQVDRVIEIDGAPPPGADQSEEAEQLQFDWSVGAEKIDPDLQPELAALWEGLLGRIFGMGFDAAELIEILKQLGTGDARVLLQMETGSHYPEPGTSARYEKLERLSLVARQRWPVLTRAKLAMALFSFFGIQCTLVYVELIADYKYLPSEQMPPLNVIINAINHQLPYALALSVVAIGLLTWQRVGTYALTSLGHALQVSGKKYARTSREFAAGSKNNRARTEPEYSRPSHRAD